MPELPESPYLIRKEEKKAQRIRHLKSKGCSDEELLEKCDFDMLTRKTLGLEHLDDAAPSIDT